MNVTLESIAADIVEIKAKLVELFLSDPIHERLDNIARQELLDSQQRFQQLQQERLMITQLQMEGYTIEEAIAYYKRMLKGERPWLDNIKEKQNGVDNT